jgi:acyl-[acyl-carrier-protein]-phospholipid O-acyltransferase/long-chain-fatty-acid--[acyl-carrier-protein] ligase
MEAKWEKMEGFDKGERLFLRGPNTALGYMMNDRPGEIQHFPGGWDDTGDIISRTREDYLVFEERAKRLAKIGAEYVPLSRIEKMAKEASQRPKAEHGAIEGVNKIVLFTTDPVLKSTDLGTAAKKLNLDTLGLPKNPDIHYMKELPHLGIGKINYPALKKLFNEMSQGAAPAAETAYDPPPPPAGSNGPQPGVS